MRPYDGDSVLVNGIPASGTHALQQALALSKVESDRWHYPPPVYHDARHLLVVRGLRDVLISWSRYSKRLDPDGGWNAVGRIRLFYDQSPMRYYCARFLPLLDNQHVHLVSYEKLLNDPDVIRGAVAFAGGRYREGSFEALADSNRYATRNPTPTRWRDHWSPEIEDAWQQADMPALEAIFAPYV